MRGEAMRPAAGAPGASFTLGAALVIASCARAPESSPEPRAQPPAETPAISPEQGGKVTRADDGDTVTLEGGRQVRYLGIDTPERGEPYADQAQALNRKLVAGRAVRLRRGGPEDTDRHGRLLRAVYVDEPGEAAPVCVNVALVRSGLAWVYVARDDAVDAAFLRELLHAQGEAIEARSHIWRGLLEAASGPGSLVSSRWRIHRNGCKEIAGLRLRPVSSVERELRSGKSPCRSCRPLR
jgi:endonuclease YncB( thermonuclease family)